MRAQAETGCRRVQLVLHAIYWPFKGTTYPEAESGGCASGCARGAEASRRWRGSCTGTWRLWTARQRSFASRSAPADALFRDAGSGTHTRDLLHPAEDLAGAHTSAKRIGFPSLLTTWNTLATGSSSYRKLLAVTGTSSCFAPPTGGAMKSFPSSRVTRWMATKRRTATRLFCCLGVVTGHAKLHRSGRRKCQMWTG